MQENTDQNDSEYRHFSGTVFQPAKVSWADNAVEALLGKYRKRIVEVLRETLAYSKEYERHGVLPIGLNIYPRGYWYTWKHSEYHKICLTMLKSEISLALWGCTVWYDATASFLKIPKVYRIANVSTSIKFDCYLLEPLFTEVEEVDI